MTKKLLSKNVLIFVFVACAVCSCEKKGRSSAGVNAVQDSLAFGDTKFLSDGLEGKIYLLAPGTRKLPDFDTMQAVNTIYTRTINIPNRSWKSGFPGLPDRFEWFGVEYKGNFNVINPGSYQFRLASDDGSKLFIDDSLVIDNDGLHGVFAKTGTIYLNGDQHKIKVQYMQGPRWSIALQLFARIGNDKEQSFPGTYFEIGSAGKSFSGNTLLYFAAAIILLIILIVIIAMQKKKKRKAKKEITNKNG